MPKMLDPEGPLEEEMATHPSVLERKPYVQRSLLQRVRHDRAHVHPDQSYVFPKLMWWQTVWEVKGVEGRRQEVQ